MATVITFATLFFSSSSAINDDEKKNNNNNDPTNVINTPPVAVATGNELFSVPAGFGGNPDDDQATNNINPFSTTTTTATAPVDVNGDVHPTSFDSNNIKPFFDRPQEHDKEEDPFADPTTTSFDSNTHHHQQVFVDHHPTVQSLPNNITGRPYRKDETIATLFATSRALFSVIAPRSMKNPTQPRVMELAARNCDAFKYTTTLHFRNLTLDASFFDFVLEKTPYLHQIIFSGKECILHQPNEFRSSIIASTLNYRCPELEVIDLEDVFKQFIKSRQEIFLKSLDSPFFASHHHRNLNGNGGECIIDPFEVCAGILLRHPSSLARRAAARSCFGQNHPEYCTTILHMICGGVERSGTLSLEEADKQAAAAVKLLIRYNYNPNHSISAADEEVISKMVQKEPARRNGAGFGPGFGFNGAGDFDDDDDNSSDDENNEDINQILFGDDPSNSMTGSGDRRRNKRKKDKKKEEEDDDEDNDNSSSSNHHQQSLRETPLCCAVAANQPHCVIALLEAGASHLCYNREFAGLIEIAIMNSAVDALKVLFDPKRNLFDPTKPLSDFENFLPESLRPNRLQFANDFVKAQNARQNNAPQGFGFGGGGGGGLGGASSNNNARQRDHILSMLSVDPQQTALTLACSQGQLEMVRYLVGSFPEVGARFKIENRSRILSERQSQRAKRNALVDAAVAEAEKSDENTNNNNNNNRGAAPPPSSFMLGAHPQHHNQIQIITDDPIEKDFDFARFCKSPFQLKFEEPSPLLAAAAASEPDIFRVLIENNFDVHYQNPDFSDTLRYIAKKYPKILTQNENVMKALLSQIGGISNLENNNNNDNSNSSNGNDDEEENHELSSLSTLNLLIFSSTTSSLDRRSAERHSPQINFDPFGNPHHHLDLQNESSSAPLPPGIQVLLQAGLSEENSARPLPRLWSRAEERRYLRKMVIDFELQHAGRNPLHNNNHPGFFPTNDDTDDDDQEYTGGFYRNNNDDDYYEKGSDSRNDDSVNNNNNNNSSIKDDSSSSAAERERKRLQRIEDQLLIIEYHERDLVDEQEIACHRLLQKHLPIRAQEQYGGFSTPKIMQIEEFVSNAFTDLRLLEAIMNLAAAFDNSSGADDFARGAYAASRPADPHLGFTSSSAHFLLASIRSDEYKEVLIEEVIKCLSPLFFAVWNGNVEVARAMLDSGKFDVHRPVRVFSRQWSLLQVAVMRNNIQLNDGSLTAAQFAPMLDHQQQSLQQQSPAVPMIELLLNYMKKTPLRQSRSFAPNWKEYLVDRRSSSSSTTTTTAMSPSNSFHFACVVCEHAPSPAKILSLLIQAVKEGVLTPENGEDINGISFETGFTPLLQLIHTTAVHERSSYKCLKTFLQESIIQRVSSNNSNNNNVINSYDNNGGSLIDVTNSGCWSIVTEFFKKKCLTAISHAIVFGAEDPNVIDDSVDKDDFERKTLQRQKFSEANDRILETKNENNNSSRHPRGSHGNPHRNNNLHQFGSSSSANENNRNDNNIILTFKNTTTGADIAMEVDYEHYYAAAASHFMAEPQMLQTPITFDAIRSALKKFGNGGMDPSSGAFGGGMPHQHQLPDSVVSDSIDILRLMIQQLTHNNNNDKYENILLGREIFFDALFKLDSKILEILLENGVGPDFDEDALKTYNKEKRRAHRLAVNKAIEEGRTKRDARRKKNTDNSSSNDNEKSKLVTSAKSDVTQQQKLKMVGSFAFEDPFAFRDPFYQILSAADLLPESFDEPNNNNNNHYDGSSSVNFGFPHSQISSSMMAARASSNGQFSSLSSSPSALSLVIHLHQSVGSFATPAVNTVIDLLLKHGCSANTIDKATGQNSLHTALARIEDIDRQLNVKLLRKLIKDGNADPNLPDHNGNTPLNFLFKLIEKVKRQNKTFAHSGMMMLMNQTSTNNNINTNNIFKIKGRNPLIRAIAADQSKDPDFAMMQLTGGGGGGFGMGLVDDFGLGGASSSSSNHHKTRQITSSKLNKIVEAFHELKKLGATDFKIDDENHGIDYEEVLDQLQNRRRNRDPKAIEYLRNLTTTQQKGDAKNAILLSTGSVSNCVDCSRQLMLRKPKEVEEEDRKKLFSREGISDHDEHPERKFYSRRASSSSLFPFGGEAPRTKPTSNNDDDDDTETTTRSKIPSSEEEMDKEKNNNKDGIKIHVPINAAVSRPRPYFIRKQDHDDMYRCGVCRDYFCGSCCPKVEIYRKEENNKNEKSSSSTKSICSFCRQFVMK